MVCIVPAGKNGVTIHATHDRRHNNVFFFTENVVIPSGACVTDCSGIADGLYHSCLSCSVFVECEAGVLTDGIDCSLGQQFDDREARCVDDSSTCIGDYEICVCSIKKKQQQIRRY